MAEHFGTAVTIILHRRNFWLSNIWQEAPNQNQEGQQKKTLLTDKASNSPKGTKLKKWTNRALLLS